MTLLMNHKYKTRLSSIWRFCYDKNKQYKKILGLALHAMQDYFAHQVLVKATKSQNNYFGKKGAKLVEKYSKRAFYKINEIIYSDNVQHGRDVFEDNPKVFWWRNYFAKKVTKEAHKYWQNNNKIYELRAGQNLNNNFIYTRKFKYNGYYWTVKARQYYLVVNGNYFWGLLK